ncbi:terminase small subunit [Microvirga yunnanensis]|uniref:terminase small subunit n=1 Tax=Microvirga yunnanensis TaxID=2953740 RepID=UPI0021C765DD|nr:terminase small subunit [Microvirga sp. HBU65207]
MALNDKQTRFVEEYLVDLNAAGAARRAGYSARSAAPIGHANLRKPDIAAAIAAAREARSARTGLTQDWVLDRLREMAERCMRQEPVLDRQGQPAGAFTFNAAGATKALELIGKHLGMFKDRVEPGGLRKPEDLSDEDLAALATGRSPGASAP